jgi:hypothetical protein
LKLAKLGRWNNDVRQSAKTGVDSVNYLSSANYIFYESARLFDRGASLRRECDLLALGDLLHLFQTERRPVYFHHRGVLPACFLFWRLWQISLQQRSLEALQNIA